MVEYLTFTVWVNPWCCWVDWENGKIIYQRNQFEYPHTVLNDAFCEMVAVVVENIYSCFYRITLLWNTFNTHPDIFVGVFLDHFGRDGDNFIVAADKHNSCSCLTHRTFQKGILFKSITDWDIKMSLFFCQMASLAPQTHVQIFSLLSFVVVVRILFVSRLQISPLLLNSLRLFSRLLNNNAQKNDRLYFLRLVSDCKWGEHCEATSSV